MKESDEEKEFNQNIGIENLFVDLENPVEMSGSGAATIGPAIITLVVLLATASR